ncbi:hypothetical protein [Achromobacter spanius]|uniref:hypothetical protein n=1 Tax=Achromobacter spanius TaxID=217203 RepID=UPI0032091D33
MSQPSGTPATLHFPTRYTDKEWEAVVATSWKTISDGWDNIPAEWQKFRHSELGRTSIQIARYALIGGIVAREVLRLAKPLREKTFEKAPPHSIGGCAASAIISSRSNGLRASRLRFPSSPTSSPWWT